ncbi:N-formyl peptide receptor 3-like [Biomphalaria glabrata]|uniref:N-formyl peptide receptor 3-like n=1 Tax=Biomphalaria glabrata TaxID=6526 RepID=A0A9U8DYM9_BIOGL|nr:N-formyl peptide receptor 3-like [Biomphalaria glabrata]
MVASNWKMVETTYTVHGLTSTPSTVYDDGGLVSDETRMIFQIVNFATICQAIDVFGTVTNVINAIIFARMGFNDSVNVSLFGLAISDLGCLVTLIWLNTCFNPLFNQSDIPFEAVEIQYLTAGWPHVSFTRVTSWITAFITLERCLCITIPLKVKLLITPKRVAGVVVLIFLIMVVVTLPVYYCNQFDWKYYPSKNRTLLGLVFTADREAIERILFTINSVVIPFSAFFAVIICTVILVIKLKEKTKWRQSSTAAGKSDNVSGRDQKVARMIVMVSALFIACFTPMTLFFVGMIVVPELSITGKYRNIFFICSSFSFILESTNSSLNIFIYYSMSSKYKSQFNRMFCITSQTVDGKEEL